MKPLLILLLLCSVAQAEWYVMVYTSHVTQYTMTVKYNGKTLNSYPVVAQAQWKVTLQMLCQYWLTDFPICDFNGSGLVDFQDFSYWHRNKMNDDNLIVRK